MRGERADRIFSIMVYYLYLIYNTGSNLGNRGCGQAKNLSPRRISRGTGMKASGTPPTLELRANGLPCGTLGGCRCATHPSEPVVVSQILEIQEPSFPDGAACRRRHG